MAILVMLGAAIGKVVLREAEIVAGLLLLPPLALSAIEAVQWYRLMRRLESPARGGAIRQKVVKSS